MDMNYQLVSIDRFEGDIAVCEDNSRKTHHILRQNLPEDAAEGDCLRLYADGHVEIDKEQTELRKERIRLLQNRLFSEE